MAGGDGPVTWLDRKMIELDDKTTELRRVAEEAKNSSQSNRQTLDEVVKPGLVRLDLMLVNLESDIMARMDGFGVDLKATSAQVLEWRGALGATRFWGGVALGVLALADAMLVAYLALKGG